MPIKSLAQIFRCHKVPTDVQKKLRSFNLGMFGSKAPPSARELALSLGFEVREVQMDRRERGRLVHEPFAANHFCIEVNIDDDVSTKRWTVLHEIFHWLIEPPIDPLASPKYRVGFDLGRYDNIERREEAYVNSCVEALVFGDGALEGALELYSGNEVLLKKHFGVGPVALEIARKKIRQTAW